MNLNTLGIDLAKQVFHLHGVNPRGQEVFRKRVYRDELLSEVAKLKKCTIVLEACGGANYWAREFERLGFAVKLIAPQYVKPYVKRNKNDWRDAEAICEAAQRPNMYFVPKRTERQQDIQNLHRIRERLIKGRTALINEMRGLLTEYGIVMPKSRRAFEKTFLETFAKYDEHLSGLCKETFLDLWSEYLVIKKRIRHHERKLEAFCKESVTCQRLMTIPGVGVLSATAIVAAVGDARVFRNGRQFAAWMGLTPRECSTGGKQKLYGISKRGDKYLRKLLVHGARSIIYRLSKRIDKQSVWATDLMKRKGGNRATVALANKNARVIWALITKEEEFKEFALAA